MDLNISRLLLSKQPMWQPGSGQAGSVILREIVYKTGQSD